MLALSQHLYSAQGRPCQTLSRIIPRQAESLPGPAQLWIQPLPHYAGEGTANGL